MNFIQDNIMKKIELSSVLGKSLHKDYKKNLVCIFWRFLQIYTNFGILSKFQDLFK
jgi:hypothetical protein